MEPGSIPHVFLCTVPFMILAHAWLTWRVGRVESSSETTRAPRWRWWLLALELVLGLPFLLLMLQALFSLPVG
jgi:hypothetical protein